MTIQRQDEQIVDEGGQRTAAADRPIASDLLVAICLFPALPLRRSPSLSGLIRRRVF